jgi:hypothetical protein
VENAAFRCPRCGGLLEEQDTGSDQLRLSCQVGHTFSADELFTIFTGVLDRREEFTWAATTQILDEYIALAHRLAKIARRRGDGDIADELDRRAREGERRLWRMRRGRIGTDFST